MIPFHKIRKIAINTQIPSSDNIKDKDGQGSSVSPQPLIYNFLKNSIVSDDFNRVVLEPEADIADSDYINASYVDVRLKS